jgi:CRP-like cAMP-binding protein
LDEYVFQEGDEGPRELYFITNGKVSMLHRATQSYICDLYKEMSFGELGFFSEAPR